MLFWPLCGANLLSLPWHFLPPHQKERVDFLETLPFCNFHNVFGRVDVKTLPLSAFNARCSGQRKGEIKTAYQAKRPIWKDLMQMLNSPFSHSFDDKKKKRGGGKRSPLSQNRKQKHPATKFYLIVYLGLFFSPKRTFICLSWLIMNFFFFLGDYLSTVKGHFGAQQRLPVLDKKRKRNNPYSNINSVKSPQQGNIQCYKILARATSVSDLRKILVQILY